MTWKRAGISLFASLWLPLVGCSASTDDASPAEDVPGDKASTSAKLLTSIELESGHSVTFYELEGGALSVFERASGKDARPVLTGDMQTLSPVEIYEAIARDGSVAPPTLVEAEQRFQAIDAAKALDSAPVARPPERPATPDPVGPAYYNDDEMQWFQQNLCLPIYWECLGFGRGTLTTRFWPGTIAYAAGYANYAGAATFNIWRYDSYPVNIFSLHLNQNEAWWQFAFSPGPQTWFWADIVHDEPRHAEASSYLTISTATP